MSNEYITLTEARLIWKTLPHHTSKIHWSASERFAMKTLLELYSDEELNEGAFTEYQLRATIMREIGLPHFEYNSNIAKAAVFAYNLAIEKIAEKCKIMKVHGIGHGEHEHPKEKTIVEKVEILSLKIKQ